MTTKLGRFNPPAFAFLGVLFANLAILVQGWMAVPI